MGFTRMIKEGRQAEEEATRGGPAPQRLDDGTPVTARHWGISRKQLSKLFKACRNHPQWCDTDNASDFTEKFVKPITNGTGRGLSLNLNKDNPLEVNIMISHAWSENIQEFFLDALSHLRRHEVAFICFLANYQGTPEEIDRQLGKNINASPFTQVISSPQCERLLVIPNEILKENGQGLYSRLWCDLEIKFAADAGIPIQVVHHRSSEQHLLGETTRSSRFARCGNPALPMNQDETLIRRGIEIMPPETARSQSVSVCIVSVFTAYGPLLFSRYLMTSLVGWTLGLAAGLAIGLLASLCVSKLIRPRHRDGYEVLDKVIRGAASGNYSHRRTRAKDFFSFARYGVSLAIVDVLVRCWSEGFGCAVTGIAEGMSSGICLWVVLHINEFGSWTGVFVVKPKARMAIGIVFALVLFAGGFINWKIVRAHGTASQAFGRGMTAGWMLCLCGLSACYRMPWHALNAAFTLGVVVIDQILETGLFHEVMLLLLGFGAMQLRPEWGLKNRVTICFLNVAFILGLFCLSKADEDATYPRLQEKACTGERHEV